MWIRATALGLIALLLMLPLASVPFAIPTLSVAAAVSFALALVSGIRRKDRYDLNSLREFHDAEELREIEEQLSVSDEADRVVCVHCMTVYNRRLGVCPKCGQRG